MKITFPILAALLIPNSEINDQILIDALLSNVSIVEAKILNKALKISAEFSDDQQIELSSILYLFGSRQVPLRCNLQQQTVQAAQHEFLTKPLAAIQAISSGIPKCHRTFWNAMSLSELYEIYIACSASAEKMIDLLVEPNDPMDDNQQRVYGYLCQYIGRG